MKTVYLERSSGGGRNGSWVNELDLEDVTRIVVGTGPGSFAGIRSAIAFACGFSLGRDCEVLGLPSACALVGTYRAGGSAAYGSLAVVGDARQGKRWLALFDGYAMAREVFQVDEAALAEAVPAACGVLSPDDARIGESLRTLFGARYLGGMLPTEEGLRRFAEANPSLLKPEPLPIYLNPAVRSGEPDRPSGKSA